MRPLERSPAGEDHVELISQRVRIGAGGFLSIHAAGHRLQRYRLLCHGGVFGRHIAKLFELILVTANSADACVYEYVI